MSYAGMHHDYLKGRSTNENSHPQYLSKRQYFDELETFINVAQQPYNVKPGTGADVSSLIQLVLDTAPNGSVLYFPAGTYIVTTGVVTGRSGLTLWLAPGAVLVGGGTFVFSLQGEVGVVDENLTLDAAEHQQDNFTVASTADLVVDAWYILEDTESPATGSQTKKELIRIRSKTATTFNTWQPIVNDYQVVRTAKITEVTPVQNFKITGEGTIQNPTSNGDGIRAEYTVNCTVSGIRLEDVDAQGIKARYSLGFKTLDANFADSPRFDGSHGYGVAYTACVASLVQGCYGVRNRHSVDITFWCRNVSVVGNVVSAGALGPFTCHPNVKNILFLGNTIDGARGHVAGSPSTEMGNANAAAGLIIREACENILVIGNTFKNINTYGVGSIGALCEGLVIVGNAFDNVNSRDAVDWGAITVGGGGVGQATMPGVIIAYNTIQNCQRYGIRCSVNDALIFGNTIRDMGGTSRWGIMVTSNGVDPIHGVVVAHNQITGGNVGVFIGGTALGGTGDVYDIFVGPGNHIQSTADSGIYTRFTTDVTVNDIHINGNFVESCNTSNGADDSGIRVIEENGVSHDLGRFFITDNVCWGSFQSQIVVGMSNATVSGNLCFDGPTFGIRLRGVLDASVIRRLRVFDNTCMNNTVAGILVSSNAVDILGRVEDSVIAGNICIENGVGIQERDTATSNRYIGNFCYDSNAGTSHGIWIRGDNAKLFDNDCSDLGAATQDNGIFIDTTATGTRLSRNITEGNTANQVLDSGTGTIDYYRESGSTVVFNELGADMDVRIEGDTDANLLFTDASTDRIGVGTATPSAKLDVVTGAVINSSGADSDTRIAGDTDANAFFLDASAGGGSVGIGTNAPSAKLHVSGSLWTEGTSLDQFLVNGPSGECFRIDTDQELIWSQLPHKFNNLLSVENGACFVRTEVSSTPYSVTREHVYFSFDASGGAITANLPSLATLGDFNMVAWFKNQVGSGNNVTLDADGTDTIDGAGTLVLTPGDSVMLLGDPSTSDWEVN